jgi:hypothetical protein
VTKATATAIGCRAKEVALSYGSSDEGDMIITGTSMSSSSKGVSKPKGALPPLAPHFQPLVEILRRMSDNGVDSPPQVAVSERLVDRRPEFFEKLAGDNITGPEDYFKAASKARVIVRDIAAGQVWLHVNWR